MELNVLSQIARNVQRLGGDADILTGFVAAGFTISSAFARGFYERALAEAEGDAGELLPFPERFAVRVGEKIGKKAYEWIEDKRISFAPDIWLFDAAAPEWGTKLARPAPSFQFLIECKDHGACTKGQLRGYPFMQKELFQSEGVSAFTLLICDSVTEEEAAGFSAVLHWSDYLDLARAALADVRDEAEKQALAQFLLAFEALLEPDMKALSSPSINDAAAAQRLCEWIRGRVPCEGSIIPLVDPATGANAHSSRKTLVLAGDRRTGLALEVLRNHSKFRLELMRTKDGKVLSRAQSVEINAEYPKALLHDLLANLRREIEGYLRYN